MHSMGRLLSDEKGAVSLEFTVLFPFFIFLMILFTDAAAIYMTHTEMYNVARDAARRMATNELKTEDEVVTYASEHLFLGSRTYTVHSGFSKEMRVAVVLPMRQAVFFGAIFFEGLFGESLIATATVAKEPRVIPRA